MLEAISDHASVLNTAALARRGISDASLELFGGQLETQKHGTPQRRVRRALSFA